MGIVPLGSWFRAASGWKSLALGGQVQPAGAGRALSRVLACGLQEGPVSVPHRLVAGPLSPSSASLPWTPVLLATGLGPRPPGSKGG